MAVYRATPTCPFCGAPTADAIYNKTPKNWIGDSFSHWQDINHSCKQMRKYLREYAKRPEVIEARKRLDKAIKEIKNKEK